MGPFAKIFAVVNLVLAVGFLFAAATLLGTADNYKAKLEQAEAVGAQEAKRLTGQLNEQRGMATSATTRAGTLENELATAKSGSQRLLDDNRGLKDHLDRVGRDVEALKGVADRNREDLDNSLKRSNELQDAVARAQTAERASTDKADGLRADLERERQRNRNLTDMNAQLERDKTSLSATLEKKNNLIALANTIYGADWQNRVAQRPMKAVVTDADNDLNIVIISVGSSDEVQAGYRFHVSRGNNYVGMLVIDKVGDNWAAGHMLKDFSKDMPQAGDEANSHL